jgi:formylglycine-generating enzyme required for sulfatase activity
LASNAALPCQLKFVGPIPASFLSCSKLKPRNFLKKFFYLPVYEMKTKTLLLTAALIASVCLSAIPRTRSGAGTEHGRAVLTGKTPRRNMPSERTVRTPSGIELVLIPAGSFMMGSDHSQEDSEEGDERPVHRVRIKYSFYMGKYEVTQAQYHAVMGTNPSYSKGDDLPVERVGWPNALEFTRRLNARNDGYTYRLPSEAEWEYACRAGTTTDFAFGLSLSSSQANFDGTEPFGGAPKGINRQDTTPVGSFAPNAWGLYDMHGNVYEWCMDAYHDSYDDAPADGSAWVTDDLTGWRVLRGGSWSDDGNSLRSPSRERLNPVICDETIGFRVAAIARKK